MDKLLVGPFRESFSLYCRSSDGGGVAKRALKNIFKKRNFVLKFE